MKQTHEPTACERVPYSAYYANGKWSRQFRCPACGEVERHSVIELGLRKLLCNGAKMEPEPPEAVINC